MEKKVKLFDVYNLILFKYFSGDYGDNYIKIKLPVVDFLKKLKFNNKEIEDKLIKGIDLFFLMKFYFSYYTSDKNLNLEQIKQLFNKEEIKYLKIQNCRSKSNQNVNLKTCRLLEVYQEITCSESYSLLINKNPYNYFSDSNEIIPDQAIGIIIQVFSNYTYIICYEYFSMESPKLNNLISTKASANFIKKLLCETYMRSRDIKIILNYFFTFYKNMKRNDKLKLSENSAIIEVFINLLIYQINFEENYLQKNKNILKYFNTKLIFQILIMNINKNKGNCLIIDKFSTIMSYILLSKSYNFLYLLEVFDTSNIKLDVCRILITKLLISIPKAIPKIYYYTRIIRTLLDLIFIKKFEDENNVGLKLFLNELFPILVTKFTEDFNFSYIFFRELNQNLLKKFGFHLSNNQEEMFIVKQTKNSFSSFITINQCKYLKTIVDNFDLLIKSKFSDLFNRSDRKIFNKFMIIFQKLFNKHKFYYDNLSNQHVKNLQTYIAVYFENSNYIIIANNFINFFTKYIFKNITNNFTTCNNLINVNDEIKSIIALNIEFSDESIEKVLIIDNSIITFHNLIEKMASSQYLDSIQNSIENILSISPFNNIQVLTEILRAYLDGKVLIQCEQIIDLEFIYTQNLNSTIIKFHDTEEISVNKSMINNFSKINNLYNIIKLKILQCAINSILVFSFDEVKSRFPLYDLIKLIVLFIKNSTLEQIDMLETSLNCILHILKEDESKSDPNVKKVIYEIISILDELEIKTENEGKLLVEIKKELSFSNKFTNETDNISIVSNNKTINMQLTTNEELDKLNKHIIKYSNTENNFEKSWILNQMNKILINIIPQTNNKIHVDLEIIKKLYHFFSENYKVINLYISKVAFENLVNLFEICIYTKDAKFILFYLNLIKSSIKEHYVDRKNKEPSTIITFENQCTIKLMALLDKLVSIHKYGSLLFYKPLMELILEYFDDHFNQLDHSVKSSALSMIGNIINYCGLEMSQYLSLLIKTCLNHLKKIISVEIELKRSCAYVLFKIIQNCDFNHYKDHASQIYNCLKLNLEDESYDKVLIFHLKKSMNHINDCIEAFYNITNN